MVLRLQLCMSMVVATLLLHHRDANIDIYCTGAVDMDLYGAFQLCSLGILAAPVIARLSRTYFLDPGRNIIFLWTGLILAGKGQL